MARTNKLIDASYDEVESAKQTAITLIPQNSTTQNTMDLFFSDKLEEVESGIRNLNDFSNKSWLLSSILLYTLIYSRDLYVQSGLDWAEYSKQARERLGLEPRDISEQLSAARFFIKNHEALTRAGFNPVGANRKLARAELAQQLCGNVYEVIEHLAKDTWAEYNAWYSSFKKKLPATNESVRQDIVCSKNRYEMCGTVAVTISDKLPEEEQNRLNGYMKQIFDLISKGYEPAIIECYDKKEASLLERLRDKHRQGK